MCYTFAVLLQNESYLTLDKTHLTHENTPKNRPTTEIVPNYSSSVFIAQTNNSSNKFV